MTYFVVSPPDSIEEIASVEEDRVPRVISVVPSEHPDHAVTIQLQLGGQGGPSQAGQGGEQVHVGAHIVGHYSTFAMPCVLHLVTRPWGPPRYGGGPHAPLECGLLAAQQGTVAPSPLPANQSCSVV